MKFCPRVPPLAVLAAVFATATALAAPVAPHPPLSPTGKQLLAAQPGKKVQPCPDARTVGLPVYPKSFCLTNTTETSNGSKVFSELILVSKDSVKVVHDWYAKHLQGWHFRATGNHFVPPSWTVDRILTEPDVIVEKATDARLALFKISYNLSGMQTIINVRYAPQHGSTR